MATRMQQRRGTAAQWTAANPILAAGEIGFETDTSKFKMGNGSSTWSALQYFANAAELAAIIDGAPALLNTLDELAAAIGDDANFAATVAGHTSATTNVHGITNTAALATTAAMNTAISISATASAQDATSKVSLHEADTTSVHGIADTSLLATKAYADSAVSTHEADTTSVHGITDTSLLATKAYADSAVATHEADTTSVHGIANTALLATTANVATAKSEAIAQAATDAASAVSNHEADTTSVHGIADTSLLATKTYADSAVSTHNADTTNVHGIADTLVLVTQTELTNAITGATVDPATQAGTGLVWDSVNSEFDLDNTYITTATQTALDLKAPKASPTFTGTVSGVTKSHVGLGSVDNTSDADKPLSTAATTALGLKAPLASPTFTGTVSGITKSMVGLGSVDNTTDAAKPISTATQTALDLKAPLASPALTGVPTAPTAAAATNTTQVATTAYVRAEVAALVNSAGATLDTLGEIATALGNDANLSTTLTNSIALKAPLASPTFTGTVSGITKSMVGLGSVDNTADSAKPVSTAQQTALDAKLSSATAASTYAPLASPTFTGTVTLPAAGIVFSDGTQAKVGVPSITTIATEITATGTIASGEQDKFIPLSGAVVITLPATGYSTGQSIDFWQKTGSGASFASTNGVIGTPGRNFRANNSVATALKISGGWLVFGDLSA